MFEPLLIAVILVALVFEFINGFHDTANAIATSVYTHTLRAGVAIGMAAVMNFCGALVSERVAMTISKGIVATEPAQYVILAALIGAVIWNIITWYFGIPSSSSHALIGSLIGAVIVAAGGVRSILWGGVLHKIVIPLFTSPILGLIAGFLVMKLFFVLFRNISHPRINRVFSKLQVISAAFVAFSHGNNDAQKTMGIITLALISSGALSGDAGIPLWVKISCAGVMALGTSIGGRRIMKTVGHKVTRLEPVSGFAAETAAAAVIELSTYNGAPVSTTHVITSAVMGVGSSKRASSVNWKIAGNIVLTWFITLPITITLGGVAAWLLSFIF